MNLANTSGTKCPKCENSSFELSEDFPTGAAFKFYYIRCFSCKTFLQAIPFHNTNTLLRKIMKHFNIN